MATPTISPCDRPPPFIFESHYKEKVIKNQEECQQKAINLGQEAPHLKFNESPFEQFYEIGDELGSGQFAVVRKVTRRSTGEKFAAKFIKKRRYATSRRGVPRAHIEREVEVLRDIGGHENVIELYDVFETPTDVILVLELVSGGELFDHVCANECLDETEAAAFIKQILLGVMHLHSRFVVHLDIKPENIMLKEKGKPRIKLIDFGLSRHIYPGIPVKDMIGTPEFVAPEVVNYEPLSPATDMWALGVVTYILLSGGSPFLGRNREETFCNITAVNYHFSPNYFANISQHAKDFISRLFVRDMRKRATVENCLTHPWIRGPELGFEELRRNSIVSVAHLREYKVRMKWRRLIEVVCICNRITRRIRQEIFKAKLKGLPPVESRYDPIRSVVRSSPKNCAAAAVRLFMSSLISVLGLPPKFAHMPLGNVYTSLSIKICRNLIIPNFNEQIVPRAILSNEEIG